MGSFWEPGAHFGGPEAHFEDFWDCGDFWTVSATKKYLHFEAKTDPGTHIWECLIFDVFLEPRFSTFFGIWGAQRLHFGSHFVSIWGALGM